MSPNSSESEVRGLLPSHFVFAAGRRVTEFCVLLIVGWVHAVWSERPFTILVIINTCHA